MKGCAPGLAFKKRPGQLENGLHVFICNNSYLLGLLSYTDIVQKEVVLKHGIGEPLKMAMLF